ncbi:MAG TPA: hypothetical protein VNU46_00720 [Gemmatimonadaceae bacterium]|jgi:hypothetical protein|nr:hypothetical protein [Gemmatimonadaceae bacterium]
MHVHHFHLGPAKPSTNGAPQVVAVGFLALVFFMLLFPMVRVWIDGSMDSRILLQVLKTDAGVNVFAFVLLFVPPIGIAMAMLFRSAWRIASALLALVAVILIPLTWLTVRHEMREMMGSAVSVTPALGSYILLVGYVTLAIVTGTAALRARR